MNWSTQAGWTGYSPTASHQTQTQPTLFTPYQPPPFDFKSQVDLTGYSAGPGVATHQTQTMSFTPHQPLQFNFGTVTQVSPDAFRVQVNANSHQHNPNDSVNGLVQLPPAFTAPNIQTVPIQTLPAPLTQGSGPLAAIQVPPAPPKPPMEPGVINIPQNHSGLSADSKESKGNPGHSK